MNPFSFHDFKPVTARDAKVQNGLCECGNYHFAYQHLSKVERQALAITEQHLTAPHAEMNAKNAFSVRRIKADAFKAYANVFNTARAAITFVAAHRPGYVVVKVGKKYVPATPEFADKMGLKIISS